MSDCKTGYVEWIDIETEEIVKTAKNIAFMKAVEFIPDKSIIPYDGFYIMNLNVLMKGTELPLRKIYGYSPYKYPPQFYYSIEYFHNNESNLQYEGSSELFNLGEDCIPVPRFVIGYDYLVMDNVKN